MKNMAHALFGLLYLKLLCDVSSGGVMTYNTDTPDIPAPNIIRDYPPCNEGPQQNCLVMCSVSSVSQAQLSWYNGSAIYSSITVSNLNNKLYLVVHKEDKNNYSCVVSSSGTNSSSYLNVTHLCQICSVVTTTLIPVNEGESVTLPTNLIQLHDGDDIMWFYESTFISEFYENLTIYHDCIDGRFSNILQLDSETGSLTITNLSKKHTGVYKLKSPTGSLINHQQQECQGYNVIVYDPLPVPIITNDSTQCSASLKCVVMCSVNVRDVSLSWYKGSSLLSNISVSDLKSNFLCMEVEFRDPNTYSCVVSNSFTNKTTQLNIKALCREEIQEFKIVVIIGAVGVGVCVIVAVFGVIGCCCYRRRSANPRYNQI
ncbi:uncharacterized protein [Misgurnus anguillicaudatus]|uniref:uncharacterized protein n=1 Tax=Misgurnus anguillicaudatus TaxID=75329 RepID=UPI003CCF974E